MKRGENWRRNPKYEVVILLQRFTAKVEILRSFASSNRKEEVAAAIRRGRRERIEEKPQPFGNGFGGKCREQCASLSFVCVRERDTLNLNSKKKCIYMRFGSVYHKYLVMGRLEPKLSTLSYPSTEVPDICRQNLPNLSAQVGIYIRILSGSSCLYDRKNKKIEKLDPN